MVTFWYLGGGTLLEIYNDSIIQLIQNIFPNYKWLPWRFKILSKGAWDQILLGWKFLRIF